MVLRLCFSALIFLYGGLALAEPMPRWVTLSRLLTLDSEKLPRSTVISRLRKIDDLEAKVKLGLKSPDYRYYALDIISALELKDFIEPLQSSVLVDVDGYNILTLNTLLDKKSVKPIAEAYRKHIETNISTLSPGAIVALIDSLARWGTPMTKQSVESLLAHNYTEVRLSVLDYLRSMILVYRKKNYLNFLPKLMDMQPFQVRLKSLYLFDDLPGGSARGKLLGNCFKDKNALVRLQCRRFQEKWSKSL